MKGFTLIEILVATAIFTMLIFAVFAVMDVGRGAWITGDTSVEIRQEIIKAFTRMERELKETRPSQQSLPNNGVPYSSITFNLPQDIDGDNTILDANGNVEWSGNIIYALNANNQITRTASGVTTILANNIITLEFIRPVSPNNLLDVDITAQKVSSMGRVAQDTEQITIRMRN